jgi:hypothetical protein
LNSLECDRELVLVEGDIGQSRASQAEIIRNLAGHDHSANPLGSFGVVLSDPCHVAEELANDAIVTAGYLELDYDVVLRAIHGEDIDEPPSNGEFDAGDALVLEETETRLQYRQILSEKVSQVRLVGELLRRCDRGRLGFRGRLSGCGSFPDRGRINTRVIQTEAASIDLIEEIVVTWPGAIVNSAGCIGGHSNQMCPNRGLFDLGIAAVKPVDGLLTR